MSEEKSMEIVAPAETSNGEITPFVPSGNYRLTDDQKKAAQLMVANSMLPKKGTKRKSYIEIADELGIHRDTLLAWRSMPEFARYKNDMVTLALNDAQAMATARLIELVNGDHNQMPSIRAIQTLFELTGRLKSKTQEVNVMVNQHNGNDLRDVSDDELDSIIGEYVELDN